ncbi:MAG TPA: DUF4252 domain-containing protein [Thermoanaerobaculia bacterium]|nr:DUF4252 domain-containing protein [Thermoanaerobaculia bacterium]
MRQAFAAALFLSSALAFNGCAGAPEVEQVRWEIEHRLPGARFEREEHFHLGRISMGLLRGLVHLTPAEPEEMEPLRQIRSLEIGVYKVRSLPDLGQSDALLDRFEDRLADHGWSLALRTRDADERTWMFVRSRPDGTLSNFFIVSLEQDEMVLLRMDGRLDRFFAEGMAKNPRRAVKAVSDEEPAPEAPDVEPSSR